MTTDNKKHKPSRNLSLNKTQIIILLVAVVISAIIYFKYFHFSAENKLIKDVPITATSAISKGEVSFLKSKESTAITTIIAEISENDQSQERGLMYRENMPDTCGMIFIFEKERPQSFWMKNTIISLDIIYVDADMKIVSIAENTVPFSEAPIPSLKSAQYVVEVNAGFCYSHGIKADDFIKFKRQ